MIRRMQSFVLTSVRPLSLLALTALALGVACSSESSSFTGNTADGAAGEPPLSSNGGGGANGAAGNATRPNGGTGNANGSAGNANGGHGNGDGGTASTSGGASNASGGASGAGGKGSGGTNGTGGKGSGGVSGTGGSTSTGGGKSAGCGMTGSKTGDYTSTIVVGTATRSFEVIVGSGYSTNTAVPLTFVYHGLGGDPSVSKAFGLQDAASRAGNVGVFVFPAGVSQGGDIGWNDSCGGSDVAFFDALNKQLEAQYCIATNRVYVAGFSWGADFTNSLACCRGNLLRAVEPASGGLFTSGCTATGPALRLTSGGTSDTYYTQADFMSGLTHARTVNHCTTTQAPIAPSPCQAYQGCDAGKPVIWCSYPNMGHQLPDGWADSTWAFLSSFQ